MRDASPERSRVPGTLGGARAALVIAMIALSPISGSAGAATPSETNVTPEAGSEAAPDKTPEEATEKPGPRLQIYGAVNLGLIYDLKMVTTDHLRDPRDTRDSLQEDAEVVDEWKGEAK